MEILWLSFVGPEPFHTPADHRCPDQPNAQNIGLGGRWACRFRPLGPSLQVMGIASSAEAFRGQLFCCSVHGGAEPAILGPVRGGATQQDPWISARMVPMTPPTTRHLKPPLLLFKYSANVPTSRSSQRFSAMPSFSTYWNPALSLRNHTHTSSVTSYRSLPPKLAFLPEIWFLSYSKYEQTLWIQICVPAWNVLHISHGAP